MRRLMPLAASLLAIALAQGVEPVVATPFDIRHDASELLDDLKSRRGEPGALLERVQNLVARHGDRMITDGELCAPLAELFAIRLADMGLAETFARTYDGTAERRLRDAIRARANEADLRTLALSYPGTAAAKQAWRHLADQAWDSGRLGQYLDYARRAGESGDKQRSQRVTAASTLLTPDHTVDLPESLDGLEEMWRIELSDAIDAAASPAVPAPDRRLRRMRRQINTPARFILASAPGELTAASDGQKIFLYDHLIGRLVGEVRTLGNVPLGQSKARPAVTRNGFIGMGWVEDHAVLMSLDQLGEVKWRWNSPSLGPIEALSAPVVLDNLVVFSALVLGNQEGAELRALAFRVDTGRPVWNTLIARIPLPRQQMIFASNDVGLSSPTLAVHGGSLVVLSNNGLIARLGIDGNVNRLWTYPSIGDEFDNGFGGTTVPTRQGALASDGTFLVASPSDSPGTIFYLGPNDHAPRRFQGDGANGEVLDVVGGLALLAGPRNLALFDIAGGKVRWAIPFAGRDGVQGRIGKDRVLLSTNEQLALIDSTSGRVTGSRGLAKGISLAITADLVMAANNQHVIGWGRGASFLERLTKAAAADPTDFRPWGTLASFHESRDDREKAFACLIEALTRGAPVEYAERAARLVRGQLELGVGDDKAFVAPLAKLQSLTMHDDRLKGEIALWRGRHAELRGDAAGAISSFKTATTFPDHRMLLKDRLEARVHVLARNGLVRLKATPEISLPPVSRRPLPKANSAWNIPGRRGDTMLVAGEVAVGFSDGFLSATKVADGTMLWRRQPVRQLLGVRTTLNPNLDNTEGIPIQEVVPGSSADGAGMRNGDVLLTFQGRKTTNFDRDLRAVVATMVPRTPFTMTVLRGGAEIELKGLLGGEPVEPLAANDKTLLLWLTTPLGAAVQPGRQQSVPEGMWFAAVDLATGTELFRYALRPTNETGEPPPQPLLTANDLVLTQDGSDLVCLQAHGGKAGEAPAPLWRMPLGEEGMDRVRVLSPELLWLPEEGRKRVHLIDLLTGTTRFVLPEDLAADPILIGNTCFCLGREGRITCWDLGIGRQRWRSTKVYGRLHAMSGDGLYATDENNQLVVLDAFSGEVRRRFGEWAAIESVSAGSDVLSVFVRRADRSQALARISLAGGNVQWEQVLPHGVEVSKLIDAPEAFGAQLFEGGDRRAVTVMMVGKDGAIRSAQSLSVEEKVVPIDGGLLAYGPAGLRVLPNVLPTPPPAIACTEVQADGDLTAVAQAALPKANWQMVGSASYAVARHRGGLLLFARLGADSKPLSLRLGDGEQAIDGAGLMAIFSVTSPQFIGTGSWVVDGAKRLSAEGEQPLLVLRLQAAPDRVPGTALSLRADCGDTTDAANAPWWLRRAWRPVTGGP
ncbi:MAG: PQQ-binding-like beta-propeller repeat protein [Planctomycetes bacterium]|nr:PQQ-binding-like beta-propeller repeat protein [Planctomycetota bacterium]